MPHITVQVIAPGSELDARTLSFDDLSLDLSLADLKSFVNAETNVPPASQHLFLNGRYLQDQDEKTLAEIGVKDEDMLAMSLQPPGKPTSTNNNNPRNQQQSSQQNLRDQGMQDIETMRNSLLNDPNALQQLRMSRPALAALINDPVRFREALVQMEREAEDNRAEKLEQLRQLNDEPFNVEAQKRIEEMIRQESVQENLQFAYEFNPEVFARVTMLYIPVHVNKHPIKAFVDSGAQTTIMSPSCAEACGIMRLIDKRYSGIAKGVGTAQILGRVHSAPIKIGNSTMSCSFTVMEGKDVDLLLGLDMLKRFQAVIDLKQSKLVFGDGNEVAFLGEADIPKYLDDAMEAEPTIRGPNGTEVGAQSGTVKPAGTSAAAASSSSSNPDNSFRGPGQTLGVSSNSKAPMPRGPAASGNSLASRPITSQRQSFPKEHIDQLVSLGFTKAEAIAALNACDGNVEYAAGLLFQG